MILIMGQAGAGKSVQGEALVQSHGYTWISTGVLLRAAMQEPEVREKMEQGDLLGDELVEQVVADALTNADDPGKVILDGFPRTLAQAKWLWDYTTAHQLPITGILLLDIDFNTALERLLKRGRTDDKEDVVRHRFDEYQSVTLPMIEFFEQQQIPVHKIDGHGDVDEVHERVLTELGL